MVCRRGLLFQPTNNSHTRGWPHIQEASQGVPWAAFRIWDHEKECRPLPDLPFRPYPSTMPVEDALDDGQADAGALKVSSCMESLEGVEELVGVGHVKSSAVVPDVEGPLPAVGGRLTHFDPRMVCLGSELPCIAKEVLQHHPH